jgi:hypothetical protein
MLTGFTKKAISLAQYNREHGIRGWNNLVYDWDVEFIGYQRSDDDSPQGYIKFHVIAEIVEVLVITRDKKNYKKTKVPGYKLTITQNMALPGHVCESLIVYEEDFMKNQFSKAIDAFQRELLNIQSWIEIAESRADLVPKNKDVFECPFCGWVKDSWQDDITCYGCGKRFWSKKLLQAQR